MTRLWLAVARYSAKRAGGRFVRTLTFERPSHLPNIEPLIDFNVGRAPTVQSFHRVSRIHFEDEDES